ncbi:MAG TPA: TonB-dependent receptor [Caulobacteraceae bacterium]|nr:TonB-dependent receptor [Caulobacteraceae bacterium]
MGSVAVVAALSAWSTTASAQAQTPTTAAIATNESTDTEVAAVTVTGSRIIRDGTSSPTPLEVVGADEIEKQASGNINALLTTLPAFAGNQQPMNPSATANASGALSGLNLVNLRGLGSNRTLVLIDGQRFIPTQTYGSSSINAVDLGGIPEQLISRVETVTGGASAVYGSDAVGGAINFILDRRFTGVKVDVSASETTYGDDKGSRLAATWGTQFLGDRGHFLISGLVAEKENLQITGNRGWDHKSLCTMTNPNFTPTNGQPQRLIVDQCGENSAPGGVINTGPLRGTTFGAGGTPFPFIYGPLVSTPLMSGGSWHLAADTHLYRGISLDPEDRRQNVFSLATYDISTKTRLTVMASWGHTETRTQDNLQFFDSNAGVNIKTDNAFIPDSLRPALVGTSSFTLSTLNGDLTNIHSHTSRYVERASAALDGGFNLFNTDWTWNVYYQYGKTRNLLQDFSLSRSRYAHATDAVFTSTGAIACRINTDPSTTNDDPTCIPYNLFGLGVNSPDAIKYVSSVGEVHQSNTQQVWSGSVNGEPFSLWAGPIGIALSAEHRIESADGHSNAGALANDLYSGNYKPVVGDYNVTEGAIEAQVPLAKDMFLAKSLEVQLAARETNYSTSGNVTTWKVGATYQPVEDVVFRGNISHDIRAGNLGELFAFAGAPVVTPIGVDPFTNLSGTIARVSSTGNPDLKPEEADSYGYGVVWKPSFLPGFSASVDYWKVDISGLIASISAGQALQLCFSGNADACGFITRLSSPTSPGVGPYTGQQFGPVETIVTTYVNIANNTTSGLDQFVAYRFPLESLVPGAPGNLALRLDGTYYYKGYNNAGLPGALPSYTSAYWRGVFGADYNLGDWSFGLRARYASKNASQPNLPQIIQCTTSCPHQADIPANFTTQNYVLLKSSQFFDFNVSRNFTVKDMQAQVYLNIRNVLNREPVIQPTGGQPFSFHVANGDDALGRTYRVGLRIRM